MTQAGLLAHGQSLVVPQGHVQQMIQRMSPGHTYYQMQQKQQQQVPPQVNGGLRTVVPKKSVSPFTAVGSHKPLVISGNSNGGAISNTHLLAQQMQNLIVGAQINPSPSGPNPMLPNVVTALSQGHNQTPPPPYSQACLQVTTTSGLSGGTMGGAQLSVHREHTEQQDFHREPPMLDASVMSVQPEGAQIMQTVASAAVSATRKPMGVNHMPVIMSSVRSKEVTKPMPQTATAPVGLPAPSGGLPSNHIAQVQTHNSNLLLPNQQKLKQHHVLPPARRDLPVPVTLSNQLGTQITRNGGGCGGHTIEHLAASINTQTPDQNLSQRQGPFSQNHLQALKLQNGTMYHQFASDTSVSTPRSDSPVSRLTNQSPMSVPSTASSPSTNSDVPDKPPPPYPGRGIVGLNKGLMPQLNPPLLPPRVPLKDKPPPPPPPGDQEHLPPVVVQAQMLNLPPSHASALFPQTSSSSSSPSSPCTTLMSNSSPALASLPSSQNGVTSNSSPVQQIDTGVVPAGGCPHLIIPQVINSTPPSETDETDIDSSGASQGHISPSPKCSTCNAQEKHRCMSPLPERKSEARERDRLRCDTKVKVYSPQAFKFYMEQHVENILKSHTQRVSRRLQLEKEMAKVNLSEEAARQMRKMLHQKESNYIRLKRAKMDSSMFEKIQTLGVGAFGEVALVRKKDVGSLYAMKTLKKSNVIKRNQVAHVKAERDILAEADNEWVVKLYYSFQDQDNLYFVMDYVPGGDLMGLLIRKEILDEHLAQFYIAELVLAIESVHRMGFIHRDIKPDNILIDKDGHIKLTDFGLCTGFRWTHNSKYYQKGEFISHDTFTYWQHQEIYYILMFQFI